MNISFNTNTNNRFYDISEMICNTFAYDEKTGIVYYRLGENVILTFTNSNISHHYYSTMRNIMVRDMKENETLTIKF